MPNGLAETERGNTMSKISLTLHRFVQVNTGTGMRPEFKHVERAAIVCADVSRLYERDPSQAVHVSNGDVDIAGIPYRCLACNQYPEVWTDDTDLWERHPQRCNVAYNPN